MKPSITKSTTVARHVDDITVVIKTFERPNSLISLLDSLEIFYPNIPVIIIDDSKVAIDINQFDERTTYVHTEHNIGLSEGRNRGVGLSKTEFTFIMDDDFVFTPNSRLDLLRSPLVDAGFSIAGSRMINFGIDEAIFHGRFKDHESKVIMEMEKTVRIHNGYPVYDYCHNIFLARTEFLRDNPWTPALKLHEHWDFFYRIKKNSSGLITMHPETSFGHYPNASKAYGLFRHNTEKYKDLALELNSKTKVEHIKSERSLLRDEYLSNKVRFSKLFKKKFRRV